MTPDHRRVLIADDVIAIHEDYRKVLAPSVSTRPPFAGFGDFMPGSTTPLSSSPAATFDLVFTRQGEEALAVARTALERGRPFAVAFVDVRMPPGIDGVETAQRLRALDPDLQIVLCTAYSDYSLGDIARQFPECDGLMILKKPFDPVEVQQLARALGRKWELTLQNRSAMTDLERRVAERTQELANTRVELLRALEKSEAAARVKSEFLANMSHELRTPLNAVLGMAEVLKDTPLDVAQSRYLAAIREGGESLLEIVNQIFEFVRLEDGHDRPSHEEFSIHCCLTGVINSITPRLASSAVVAELQIEPDLPEKIPGDCARLRQILLHLLSNAVKFTPQGKIVLHATCRTGTAADSHLEVSVSDTGIGIPPERLQMIFEAFTQLDASATRARGGLGLGLAIALRLARQLGGDIDVESQVGVGSRFRVRLPLSPTPSAASSSVMDACTPTGHPEVQDTHFALACPLRILVAEDNPLNQQMAGTLLGRLGYQPVFVANGEEALAVLALKPFDLVLMDVQMPVLDGLMATRILCEREPLSRRPWIVAMTARALAGDKETCLSAGMDGYLAKPFTQTELAALLRLASEQLQQRRRTPRAS